ncbi:transcription initiation factor TFIID subunit 1-like [Tigriopus californicus]|uniref:transcription initiation factor TFIID subunit 1-like n=1 Tax=Tigriopus californicus TaxID=6832 RepID=UPI0027DA859E|nr:transcription initiation factor TFIID subunit 1-like [Tigriopus californicus]
MASSSDSEDDTRFNDDEEEDNEDGPSEGGSASTRRPASGAGLSLMGLVFGNIDAQGQLTGSDVLDADSSAKLAGLEQLLGGRGAAELVEEHDLHPDPDDESASTASGAHPDKEQEEEYDGVSKDPNAQDFESMDEALSDESDSSEDEQTPATATAITPDTASVSAHTPDPNVKVEIKPDRPQDPKLEMKREVKAEEEDPAPSPSSSAVAAVDDSGQLMPPPVDIPKPASEPSIKVEAPPVKRDHRPLASMLPAKYKDVDVQELFPEFRHGQVLRFSRLFPIKESHLPRPWKHLKKKAKKRLPENSGPSGEDEVDGGPGGATSADDPHTFRTWQFDYTPYAEDANLYEEDDAVRFHRPKEENSSEEDAAEGREKESKGPKATDWRWGPAQYWYDILGVPDNVEDYDYGLKTALEHMDDDVMPDTKVKRERLESNKENEMDAPSQKRAKIEFPDDAFLMVTQTNWEEDVVWNGDDIRHKLNSKTNMAGWVPTGGNRTAGSFSQPGKGGGLPGIKLQTIKKPENGDDIFYSIFPVENEELAYGRWEDEVIWDTEDVPKKLKPKMVSLDPNDDNIILGIPDDIDPSTLPSDQPVRKVKIIQKHVKKSRMLLNRSGIISVIEEESPPPPPKVDNKDPFNISNDEFYQVKAQESMIKVAPGGTLLQHGTPVVELSAPFVPTHIGPIKLKQFHRWPLKRFSHGPLANYNNFVGVNPLTKHIKKKARAREAERQAAGGGEIFFMRTPEDLSGRDGELILVEYMEEHPPLLNLVGMATKIKNYYKRKPGSDAPSNKPKYGELVPAHTSPFLGQMVPGQVVQTFENNLYRTPIYEHKMPTTDFVVIRTRNEYSIREIDTIFCAGQECPLYEVPGPNSKKANNFARDFLQVFIYRLFWRSPDNPKRIKMDEIKRAFPAHSESSIRKRLKPCSQFHRTGHDSNWWVIKPNFRLPSEEEMRAMVTPEQCCAFFSMIAAEQRLRDAGYGEKSLLAQQDDDDEETAMKMDDEVKVAPWNTTRAYILAMKGKCLLQLTGPADPTGPAREGFSYVRIPNKPTNKEEVEQAPKRTVTGTDADLRKLPLKDARNILRKNGVPEDEIKKLSRWEVIDVVRTLSTEKVKAGEDGDHKFSRGNRFSIAEHQERYREDCQRIFETQNRVLASNEVLSSDESESSEEEEVNDDDLFEMGKNMENLLSNKKTSSQLNREREEIERRKLKMMMDEDRLDSTPQSNKRKKDDDEHSNSSQGPTKFLRITRVFKNQSGKEYTRTEIVRKPMVVETYVRIRQTKDDAYIKQFATLDDSAKEEMKKEKRRLQEQLRRIKRNQERERLGLTKSSKRKTKAKPDLKLRCGACGAKGHMRTNKACPKFVGGEFDGPINVAMTERDEEELEKEIYMEETAEESLINVDGTKMKLSGKVLKHADEIRKKTMILKVPKQTLKGGRRRRAGTVEHCDYLTNKNYKPVKRRRTDPVVSLASFLESLHSELRVMDEALQFLQPVNTKKVIDYLDKIKIPMDLATIRESIQRKKYHSREEFLGDMSQIVDNSRIYNGEQDIHTINAKRLFDVVINKFSENEEKLQKLEKAINPLLDDDDQVSLSYIFTQLLEEKLKVLPESWPFVKPVNRKAMKHYYDKIKHPMDLETISKKVAKHTYHSSREFLHDIGLIFNNSLEFNGPDSEYTKKANKLLEISQEFLNSFSEHISQLEDRIRDTQARALENADLESTTMDDMPVKKKRGRPRKKKMPLSSEFISEDARSPNLDDDDDDDEDANVNLEKDLQYSSDEDDMEDDDWEPVEGEEGSVTVTLDSNIQHQDQEVDVVNLGSMGYYQEIQAGDGRPAVQIEAPNIVYQEEEPVDENYDPTDFLHNLGAPQPVEAMEQQQQPILVQEGEGVVEATITMPDEVHEAIDLGHLQEEQQLQQQPAVDVINDDLNITDESDDDDEESGDAPQNLDDKTVVAPPAPSLIPEPPPPDEDGIWF